MHNTCFNILWQFKIQIWKFFCLPCLLFEIFERNNIFTEEVLLLCPGWSTPFSLNKAFEFFSQKCLTYFHIRSIELQIYVFCSFFFKWLVFFTHGNSWKQNSCKLSSSMSDLVIKTRKNCQSKLMFWQHKLALQQFFVKALSAWFRRLELSSSYYIVFAKLDPFLTMFHLWINQVVTWFLLAKCLKTTCGRLIF